MSAALIITILILYFGVLVGISFLTSRNADNSTFFLGERKSPWYLVSFGMIGASLSGVTFLSVPGWVGNEANQFSYMQAVFGYLFGYFVIAFVLMPIYYRMNLTSIYEYLKERFGFWSYKTGASFFLVSRMLGSSIRLLLMANVLQSILFEKWGVPFEFTVIISVLLIWIYTYRGGIKTIVWTDTLQTIVMLLSVILMVGFIADALNLSESGGVAKTISESGYAKIFFMDDLMGSNHFLKHFFGGMFITIGMTGLDQDMMQKNLSCKNIKEAQKNMIWMAFVLVVVNLIFLCLGVLLYKYAFAKEIDFGNNGDLLFSTIAMSEQVGPIIGIVFLLGLIAAVYSSADSALTALTTSFSVDFLNVNDQTPNATKIRKRVHVSMAIATILTVIFLKYFTDENAIALVMRIAGFTYGPLIGLFFFGILTKRKLADWGIPFICVLAIGITYALWYFSSGNPGVDGREIGIFGTYKFGFELIILNSLITFGLLTIWSFFIGSSKSLNEKKNDHSTA